MEKINNWNMGQDYFNVVSMQLQNTIFSLTNFYINRDNTSAWYWYSQVQGLGSLIKVAVSESDYQKINKDFEKFEEKYQIHISGNIGIELEEQKVYQYTKDLEKIQDNILRTAYKNNLLIHTLNNQSKIPIGARNYDD